MQTRKVLQVDRSPCDAFPQVSVTSDGRAVLAAVPTWQSVGCKVPAVLTISTKTDDRSRQWTAKLEMTVCQRTYDILTHYVYLLTLADGTRLLMGSDQRPYAIAEEQLELTDGNTKSQMLAVTVTLTTTHELLEL